jgi:hypothetical protein
MLKKVKMNSKLGVLQHRKYKIIAHEKMYIILLTLL